MSALSETGPAGEAFFHRLEAELGAFVRRRVRDPADADDVLQEILLRIVRGLPSLGERERIYGWVNAIARRAIADHFRAPRRERAELGDAHLLGDDPREGEPAEHADRAQRMLSSWVALAVDDLPEPYRSTLRATELEGLSQAEVAAREGISVSAVKSRVSRGRRLLRGMLDQCCRVELDARGGVMALESRSACACPTDDQGADSASASPCEPASSSPEEGASGRRLPST